MTDSGPAMLDLLAGADRRLVRTVDGLTADELAAPSSLPGWTRAHVVAHLALNGEALAGVLTGVTRGEPVAMYDSAEQRDADIAALVGAEPGELRARLMAATSSFGRAAEAFPAERADMLFERVPGGPTFAAGTVLLMRWREVEIHHADLDSGYSPADWPTDFAVAVLESASQRSWPTPFRVRAQEPARTWAYGDPAGHRSGETAAVPTVSGEVRDLAWWITGRGAGALMTAGPDDLPEVPAW